MSRPILPSQAGFTLVEMLVAVVILGLMAGFAWRALDAMMTTRQNLEQRSARLTRLDTALAQWQTDLDALQESGLVPALAFDGRILRLTRRDQSPASDSGTLQVPVLRVIAWTLDNGQWRRWASGPVTTAGNLRAAWAQARQMAAANSSPALVPLESWRILFFRNQAWVNPQSDASITTTDGSAVRRSDIPEGIRLELQIPAGDFPSGAISSDWARLDDPAPGATR